MSLLLKQSPKPEPGKTCHSDLGGGSCKSPCLGLEGEPTQAAQWEIFPVLEIPADAAVAWALVGNVEVD